MTIRHDAALAAKLYATPSQLEATLALHMRAAGLKPEPEFRFHPPRRWRFDFAFPDRMVAIECEGAIWSGGRHVRGAGFQADVVKYNQAAIDGWTLLRFTSDMIKNSEAITVIEKILKD
jgi:very-short-patch-repair endonuclease